MSEITEALEKVLAALEWMDGWGRDPDAMRLARTLHYDMAGKASSLLPLVREALRAAREPLKAVVEAAVALHQAREPDDWQTASDALHAATVSYIAAQDPPP